jgi:hypothetical protein
VPRSFVEFGFSGWEFNCVEYRESWRGLLIDADPYNVKISKILNGANITTIQKWITKEGLEVVKEWVGDAPLGILSIDVDGNDYWFLKDLICLSPVIIVAEYNSSFGHRPITIPYSPSFDRRSAHSSRQYYGASLAALNTLCSVHSYELVAVSSSGVNAFWMRRDFLDEGRLPILDPFTAFSEKVYPDGSSHRDLWNLISNLEYVDVSETQEAPHLLSPN